MPEPFVPTEEGYWVSEKFLRLSEIIQDYEPNLSLRWIPVNKRSSDDSKPYAIVHEYQGHEYIVMYASELDDPEQILAKLWIGDNKKHNTLDYLDALDASRQAFNMKEQMDLAEERQDFVEFLMRTEKNYIKTDNPITGEKKVKFDSQLRRRE